MFACVYVCVYCALCANYLSYPVLLTQSLKYNLENLFFFFNRSSEQMAPYFASSSNTNQRKIKKKVSQRISPHPRFYFMLQPLSLLLDLPFFSTSCVSTFCLFSCLELCLPCPPVFLLPTLALIGLFFVSGSWPPSCQLRQD